MFESDPVSTSIPAKVRSKIEDLFKLKHQQDLELRRAVREIERAIDAHIPGVIVVKERVQEPQLQSNTYIDAWLRSIVQSEAPTPFNDRSFPTGYVCGSTNSYVTYDRWPTHVKYDNVSHLVHEFVQMKDVVSTQQICTYFRVHGLTDPRIEKKIVFQGKRVRIRPFPSREAVHKYVEALSTADFSN